MANGGWCFHKSLLSSMVSWWMCWHGKMSLIEAGKLAKEIDEIRESKINHLIEVCLR